MERRTDVVNAYNHRLVSFCNRAAVLDFECIYINHCIAAVFHEWGGAYTHLTLYCNGGKRKTHWHNNYTLYSVIQIASVRMANVSRRSLSRVLTSYRSSVDICRWRSTAPVLKDGLPGTQSLSQTEDVVNWEDLPGPTNLPFIGTTHIFMGGKRRQNLHLITVGVGR